MEPVKERLAVIVCATVAIAALSACSKGPVEPPLKPGELAVGTASVTVNGQDAGTTTAVACVRDGNLTTITTGDSKAGTTTVVDNGHGLAAKSVSIRNIGGFTGSYWQGLDGSAEIRPIGSTFDVKGEAFGFTSDRPSARTSGTFRINVAC